MKQFFYTRKEEVPSPVVEGEESKPPTVKTFTDSFNLEMVIRSVEMNDGKLVVVLNDFHEEVRQVPVFNKQGKMTGYKNDKNTYQSEIFLEGEDVTRFRNL